MLGFVKATKTNWFYDLPKISLTSEIFFPETKFWEYQSYFSFQQVKVKLKLYNQ